MTAQPGIYSIKCLLDGSEYIGSSCDTRRRKSDHFKMLRAGRHPCRSLQAAYSAHGEAQFTFAVVAECGADSLATEEQAQINGKIARDGRELLFNSNISVERPVHTEESRELIRQSKLGPKNPFYGKTHTAESRERMSAAHAGRPAWNRGRKASPEWRAKIAASGVGRVQSDATRAKRKATMAALAAAGLLFGPEHRKNIAAAQAARRKRELLRTDL